MKNSKSNLNVVLSSLVSISSLNQGKAAKIIGDLAEDDVKIVIKNNEPIAAIVSLKRFNELCDAEEKLLEMEQKHEK